ncbi:MAG: Unknown protein [uncultured Aureispira sp.]|uniref:Uncharacterized protein n=1 Tax=uncultured Aureispira sp. TaxID=1331704 RepID=A0A6S6U443_9BACT|nr:MAG: Unknown protein [uncultured Aureispira sp.]
MRQELQNIEYIERYLENDLNNIEKRKFEQHMKQDAGFKAAVKLQRQIVSQLKEEAFLLDLADYQQEFTQQPPKGKRISPWWILLPLFILGSLPVLWYALSTASTPTEINTLTTEHISLPPSVEMESSLPPPQLKAFETNFVSKKVRAQKGATIYLKKSKSTLYIPTNAVVDKHGNPVKGAYELQYRELRDRADMAFSGLPMNYKNQETAEGLNSVGILEVRAFQNGEALQIAPGKALSLDYEVNKRAKNLDLYHLDEQAETWTETSEVIDLPKKDAYTEAFDSLAYQAAVIAHNEKFKNLGIGDGVERKNATINVETTLIPERMKKTEREERPDPNKYLVKHYKNPRLVKDLRLNSFGIYNCGQKYKVKNQIAVSADYTDLEQIIINNAHTLSIIDMNYNAAYSFKPEQFICNAKANNIFLLWSKDGKLYSFVKRATIKMNTGDYSFQMEDLSEKVKNTADLKRYLKFVEKKTKETVTKTN